MNNLQVARKEAQQPHAVFSYRDRASQLYKVPLRFICNCISHWLQLMLLLQLQQPVRTGEAALLKQIQFYWWKGTAKWAVKPQRNSSYWATLTSVQGSSRINCGQESTVTCTTALLSHANKSSVLKVLASFGLRGEVSIVGGGRSKSCNE